MTETAQNLRSADLRARAETLGQSLPPLLAAAEQLAATVILGEHGLAAELGPADAARGPHYADVERLD